MIRDKSSRFIPNHFLEISTKAELFLIELLKVADIDSSGAQFKSYKFKSF